MTIEELDFVTHYEVQIEREAEMHGMVTWFDCWFTHGPEDVCLSTSPNA